MNELPKELTNELLSLVLGVHDVKEIDKVPFTDELTYVEDCEDLRVINIDTLTRLMKEFCFSNKCLIKSIKEINNEWKIELENTRELDYEYFRADSEFEAVLKATDWVIKEKGLI